MLATGAPGRGVEICRTRAWPFANDELATFLEECFRCSARGADPASQIYRLPRIIPLAYGLHHVGTWPFRQRRIRQPRRHGLVGHVERCRGVSGPRSASGTPGGVCRGPAGGVLARTPFQSQQTRFYIAAAFFSTACLGARWALALRSLALTLLACLLALAAMFCHTLTGVLFPMLLAHAGRISGPRRVVPGRSCRDAGDAGSVALFALVYLWPLIHGWNSVAPAVIPWPIPFSPR